MTRFTDEMLKEMLQNHRRFPIFSPRDIGESFPWILGVAVLIVIILIFGAFL